MDFHSRTVLRVDISKNGTWKIDISHTCAASVGGTFNFNAFKMDVTINAEECLAGIGVETYCELLFNV